MITLYTLAYNEEVKIQFMIDFYKKRFPNCHFIIYDNYSTDNTHKIIENNSCEIRMFDSNNQIDDIQLKDLKNNCWKDSKTDWVIVCDVDEMLDITEQDLINEEKLETTIIKSEGYNMVNMENNYDLSSIIYGIPDHSYDKLYMFNKKYIRDINYVCGAHTASPIGTIKLSFKTYRAYHYTFIHPDLLVTRYKWTAKRLSENNIKYNMGTYHLDSEEKIREKFEAKRLEANKIL